MAFNLGVECTQGAGCYGDHNVRMDVMSVTVGLPVSDLAASLEWYRRALQLGEGATTRSGAGVVVRLGVDDAERQRERLQSAGIVV